MREYEDYYSYFENRLQQEKFTRQPYQLYEPILYTLQLEGKRIRPVLTLIACELFG
ncbi:MAG TPA: polyprenyl synthetase family protein, partial [Bacteroidetes bacterium]|nr:polyprenyl synthetase family protein [Bacteroidota bacterium]